jgi:hypothetical protein
MNFTVYKNLLNISSLTHSDSLSKNVSLHFWVSFLFSNIGTTFPSSLYWEGGGLLPFYASLLVFLLFYNPNKKNATSSLFKLHCSDNTALVMDVGMKEYEGVVEWSWQGENKNTRERGDTSQCKFLRHRSHADRPGIDLRPPRWKTRAEPTKKQKFLVKLQLSCGTQ